MNIEAMNRFKPRKDQLVTLDNLKKGTVDIVIATHTLLRKNIEFADLGLLIVDEEHRFGVGQKEKIKQLKKKFDWGFTTVPQTHLNGRRIPYTRGKVLGGSSSVNGMLYLRGNRENYDGWAARGCEGWGFEDILPFYKKLENHEDGETEYHGAGGPIHVTRHPENQLSPVSQAFMRATAEVCGVPVRDDFNGENQNCASTYQMSASHGVRSSTSEGYVQPSLERPNFALEIHAHVRRIVIENGQETLLFTHQITNDLASTPTEYITYTNQPEYVFAPGDRIIARYFADTSGSTGPVTVPDRLADATRGPVWSGPA